MALGQCDDGGFVIRVKWRRGSLNIAMILLLVPAVLFLTSSMNTGQLAFERRLTQDAADAIADMHGTWTARTLNVISMNNTEAAQMLTVAIGSEALHEALRALHWRARTAQGIISLHSLLCVGFRWPPRVGWCFLRHARYARPASRAIRYVRQTRSRYAPRHGITWSHRGLSAIGAMNAEVVQSFPARIGEMAKDYLDSLNMRAGHFTDACQGVGQCGRAMNGLSLPVETGGRDARLSLCQVMEFGTGITHTTARQKGFPLGRGPLLSGGDGSTPAVKTHINRLTRIGRELQRFYDYYDDLEMDRPGRDTPYPSAANFWLTQRQEGPNNFTRRFDGKLVHLCFGIGVPYRLDAPVPEFWKPVGGSVLTKGPHTKQKVPDAYRVLAHVAQPQGARAGQRTFANPDFPHYAYAQVNVFNPDGLSLFSQSWRSEFAPASRMTEPAQVARDLSTRAESDFAPLVDILRGANPAAFGPGGVNVH